MEEKYRLELIGITFNQIESGVYALVLQQVGTTRRIPIIIGFPEAQAIECKLQDIKTPRPLTHDIMIESLSRFGINLQSVFIKRLPNGVFAADLYLSDGIQNIVIDSRSSDAIALAIRVNAPIYTSEEVLNEAGFDPEDIKKKREIPQKEIKIQNKVKVSEDFNEMTLDQLSEAMLKAAESEDYEKAAKIKSKIDEIKNSTSSENS